MPQCYLLIIIYINVVFLVKLNLVGGSFPPCRCFLKLGEWQLSLQGINESTIPKVLQYYSNSTEHDRNWYKVRPSFPTLTFHL